MKKRTLKNRQEANLIRSAIDTCPDGILAAAIDGRVILTNRAMNHFCFQLTGSTVTNALTLWDVINTQAITAPGVLYLENTEKEEQLLVRLKDGSVWQIRRNLLMLHRMYIYQFIAADVSQVYKYQKILQENNQHVENLHTRQRDLIQNIIQNNLNKEMLHARMQIHDHIGQMLLVTRNALDNGTAGAGINELFAEWDHTVLNLENAKGLQNTDASVQEAELVQVAEMIGCHVRFIGTQPSERKARLLLYAAIREALTNAVMHADANELLIDIHESDLGYQIEISDNGRKTLNESIREGVGLSTLRERLESEGARMELRTSNGVTMLIEIPKE